MLLYAGYFCIPTTIFGISNLETVRFFWVLLFDLLWGKTRATHGLGMGPDCSVLSAQCPGNSGFPRRLPGGSTVLSPGWPWSAVPYGPLRRSYVQPWPASSHTWCESAPRWILEGALSIDLGSSPSRSLSLQGSVLKTPAGFAFPDAPLCLRNSGVLPSCAVAWKLSPRGKLGQS